MQMVVILSIFADRATISSGLQAKSVQLLLAQHFSKSGACPSRGCGAMLEGARMAKGNRQTYITFKGNGLI